MSSWNVLRGPIKIAIVDLPAKRTLRRGVTLLMNRERMLAGILSLFFSRKPLALYCTWTRREVGVTHITTCILFGVAKPINRLFYCLFVCSFILCQAVLPFQRNAQQWREGYGSGPPQSGDWLWTCCSACLQSFHLWPTGGKNNPVKIIVIIFHNHMMQFSRPLRGFQTCNP